MPLRDHFHAPLDDSRSWDELHGAWPTVIVMALNRNLPSRYVAAPRVHLGPHAEIDVTAYESDTPDSADARTGAADGGVATAVWAPPRPTFDVAIDMPDQDEYEVRVYDAQRHRRLVAAVEIISPANKDRPEHRRAFVAKCAALLQQHVSVALVDLVTTRRFNLYSDLLELLGQADSSLAPEPPVVYAAACRWGARGMLGTSWRGLTPLSSVSRCQRSRSGLPTTWPCRWSWKRPMRRPAAYCAFHDAAPESNRAPTRRRRDLQCEIAIHPDGRLELFVSLALEIWKYRVPVPPVRSSARRRNAAWRPRPCACLGFRVFREPRSRPADRYPARLCPDQHHSSPAGGDRHRP